MLKGQFLAHNALESHISALRVRTTQCYAMVPTEVKLIRITLQVLFAHVVKRTVKTALENGEAGFDRIGSHVTTRVFARTVIDRTMSAKVSADTLVDDGFIRHKLRMASNIFLKDGAQGVSTKWGRLLLI